MKHKTIRFLGIPLYKSREKNGIRKKYFLGICYNKKVYTKQLNVCYICDEGYVTPTLTSIMSMVLNKNKSTNLCIHVIGVNISGYSEACFEKFNYFKNVSVNVLNVENPYNNIETFHQHVSKSALLKFKIPNIFLNLDRILYIDGDTIIRKDLTELNNVDLTNNYVAAVPDMLGSVVFEHHKKFNLKKYFNSGVMLLNLELCRKDKIEEKLICNKIKDKYKHFMDQDAFNQTFEGRVVWLPPKYNVMMVNDNNVSLPFTEKAKFFGLKDSELYWNYYNASIVHLTNKLKPWKNIEASDFYLWESYYAKWQKLLSRRGFYYKKIYPDNTQRLCVLGIKLPRKPIKVKLTEFNNMMSSNLEKFHISFIEGGGMGDCLLALPFIEHLYNCCPAEIQIDFYCKNPSYYSNLHYLNNVYLIPKDINSLFGKYDAVFQIIRYGRFISGNIDKIKLLYPTLYNYIQMDEKMCKIGQVRDNLRLFNEYALTLNKKRPDQIDIFDIFGYKSQNATINLTIDEQKTLSKFGLSSKSYITVSRGADGVFNNNHPKLWPLEYYNRLIELIKQKYSMYNIIQIGADDKFGSLEVDKNLVGKTNFEEIAAMLKNSIIHIDVEGGLVHLNHFMNGKSLVLFGPTPKEVYGYSENINISGSCSLGNCYNIIPNWTDKCMLNGKNTCMHSITPEKVFNELDKFLVSQLNTWYKIVDNFSEEQLPYLPDVEPMHLPELPKDKIFMFDIDKALKLFPKVKRFGLVFFMGIGDYFYATSFIEKLKEKYPKIYFDAFVSKNFDGNNSPLVADCLKTNPHIENVYMFDGYKNYNNWRSYKYNDVYEMVNEKTLVLPMIYFHTDKTTSRLVGLCKVFGLDVPEINPNPILYDYTPDIIVQKAFEKIKTTNKKIVFVQTTTRSSAYHYIHTNDLIKMLLELGYFVITPEQTNLKNDNLYVIDIKKFKITDSISLLKQIKNYGKDIFVFNMVSSFTGISSALNIPCLTIQFWWDPCISTVYFSNMYLVTHKYYPQLAADRQFVMRKNTYEIENNKVIYKANDLIKAFNKFVELQKHV